MLQMMSSYLRIHLSRLDTRMSKQRLNITDIRPILQKMSSKAMTKRMERRFFLYSCFLHCMLENMLSRPFGQSTTALFGMKNRVTI